jgi:hypothetical protein
MEKKSSYIKFGSIILIGLLSAFLVGLQSDYYFKISFILGAIPVSFVLAVSVYLSLRFRNLKMSSKGLLFTFLFDIFFVFFFIFLGLLLYGFGNILTWGICNMCLIGTAHFHLRKGIRWWLYPVGFIFGIIGAVILYFSEIILFKAGIAMSVWSLPITLILPLSYAKELD